VDSWRSVDIFVGGEDAGDKFVARAAVTFNISGRNFSLAPAEAHRLPKSGCYPGLIHTSRQQ